MTETSDEEEELIKLIKSRKNADKEIVALKYHNNRTKSRSRSSQSIQKDANYSS
jgi:hypothetical protein